MGIYKIIDRKVSNYVLYITIYLEIYVTIIKLS